MIHPRNLPVDDAPASASTKRSASTSVEVEPSLSMARELSESLEHHRSEETEELRLARALSLNIIDLLESMKARQASDAEATGAPSAAPASRTSNRR
jgi:hypothetical protein